MNFIKTFTLLFAASTMLITGCSQPKEDQSESIEMSDLPPDTVEMEDGHPSEGPHHGGLIELGKEEYHAELVHDEDAEQVTIYVLDGSAKTAVPIEAKEVTINVQHDGQPEQFQLAAQPDQGDPEGKSSRFISDNAELIEHLDEEGATARLVLKINGKSYNGQISHSHDHAGHKH